MNGVKAFDKADYGLYPVRCEQWGFLIFVCLDDDAPAPCSTSSATCPSASPASASRSGSSSGGSSTSIDANWKLIAENFMEYYHLPWVHPSLVKVSPMDSHYRWQGDGQVRRASARRRSHRTATAGAGSACPAIEGLSEEDAVSARFAWLYPNIALNVLPEPHLPAAAAARRRPA